MEHVAKDGSAKFKPRCALPLTGANVVDMLITDLAVFSRVSRDVGFSLVELAPGVSESQVRERTSARYGLSIQQTPST
jgi:acyl CoA:acetate/3-ketoacid CoA transferase beta subunit